MNEIEKWLRGNRDYQEGIRLLERYNPKHRSLRICKERGESTFSRPKLTAALRESIQRAEWGAPPPVEIPDTPDPIPHLINVPTGQHAHLPKGDDLYPPEISKAMQTRRRLANDRDRIANTMGSKTSDEERAATYHQIEELHKEIQGFNHVIGTYQRTGKLPNRGAALIVRTPHLTADEKGQIQNQIRNLRSYISRAKKKQKEWQDKENVPNVKRRNRLRELREQITDWSNKKAALERSLIHETVAEQKST